MREDPPRIGLGTYLNADADQCAESVETALRAGYRHIDTAQEYENEAAVGAGLARADVLTSDESEGPRNSESFGSPETQRVSEDSSERRFDGVVREDVFVASKVRTENLAYEDVLETTRESLDRLGVETLDLLYVHWPLGEYDAEGTLAAFDELHAEGAVRHVGLSNFTPELLDEAREILDAPVFAHQVEMNPLCQQAELLDYAREHDHHLVAYSPLAQGAVFDVPEVTAVAEKHGVSEAQVSLAWLLGKRNVSVIPKATSEEHIRENLSARELELDAEDVDRIESIERTERTVDFDAAPWN